MTRNGAPLTYKLKGSKDQTTARASLSVWEYLCSKGVTDRLPKAISPSFCIRILARLTGDLHPRQFYLFIWVKVCDCRSNMRVVLVALKSFKLFSPLFDGISFSTSFRRGTVMVVKLSINSKQHWASPRNERTTDWFVGLAASCSAWTFSGPGDMPSLMKMC